MKLKKEIFWSALVILVNGIGAGLNILLIINKSASISAYFFVVVCSIIIMIYINKIIFLRNQKNL